MTSMQSTLRSHFRLLLFLAICVCVSNRASAQHMNAQDAPCQAPASNAEMTACFISASKTADERLNKIYIRVREVLSSDEQKDLQAAERLWLKFRDANCSAERNLYAGGSAAPTVYAACIEADTRERTTDLKAMYGWRLEKFGKAID
jgi:uncharacterized protein YecT (DUF1311 family)